MKKGKFESFWENNCVIKNPAPTNTSAHDSNSDKVPFNIDIEYKCNLGHMDCPTIHMDKYGNHGDCKWYQTDIICLECYITGT